MPMNAKGKSWPDICLAMAGIFQSTALVDQIARTGYIPSDSYESSVSSLFVQNPDSVEDVYGQAKQLEMGLQVMARLLSNKVDKDHPNTMRYVMSILHLQKKLSGNQDMLGLIGNRLEQAQRQAEHFGSPIHDNVIANLAEIYTDSISRYKFRIQVNGDITYLQQNRIANQVRALLFAGIRSATLWRQVGGSRLNILFRRKHMLRETERWLDIIREQQIH